jgi:N-acetylneuraminic acid mutarotase
MLKHTLLLILCMPIFIFGQTANFWTKKNDFGGLKRERAVAFSIDNMGYVGTGVDTAEIVKNDFWQYDALSDSWMQKANVPGSVRRDAVGFSINNKGYIGLGIDSDESLLGLKLKDFWEYDPLTNMWTQIADYPGSGGNGVYFSTAFSIDSKGYICGGKIGPNSYSNELWEYKPSINQWTQRAYFPGGVRYQLCSFSIGYYGYVGLGANQDVFKKDFWKYNAGTNQWTQISDFPASERGGACSFTIGTRGFICMGSDGGLLDDLWEYNPTIDQWASKATYGGSERKNAIAFVAYDKAYVGTGKGYSGKKAGMEEYTPGQLLETIELSEVNFSVYPNPAGSSFNIISESNNVDKFMIYSSSGQFIKEFKKDFNNKIKVDGLDFQSGIYLILAKDESGAVLQTKQLILL